MEGWKSLKKRLTIQNLWKWLLRDGGGVDLSWICAICLLVIAFHNGLTGLYYGREFLYFLKYVISLFLVSGFLFFERSPLFLSIIYLFLGTGMTIGMDYFGDFSGILLFLYAFKVLHTKRSAIIIGVIAALAFSIRFFTMSFLFSRVIILIYFFIFILISYFFIFELPEIKRKKKEKEILETFKNLNILKYSLVDQELFIINRLFKGDRYKEIAWKITQELEHEISENGVSGAISRLCKKFKVKNSCGLMVKCAELGLLDKESENSTM